MGLAEK